jgi:hypothetical protein
MKKTSMIRLSVNFSTLLVVLFFCSVTAYADSPAMPLKGELELASGFGDFRSNHFHAGIDYRTGGAVGKPVFAPVAGYVLRLKASYYGYGKVLYLKGDDGYIYVFGHLLDYAPRIDSVIESKQYDLKRYFVDFELPKDSVRVAGGELVAYSGESGAGAPHLHFEKRTADNVPLNPLTSGFPVADKVAPVISGVTFHMTDDSSLFDNAKRTISYDIISQSGKYTLSAAPYFHRPFGVLVECFDRMKPEGMKQAVYDLALYFDGELAYRATFDSLDYESRDVVRLEYDYFAAVEDDEPRIRRLYELSGNSWRGSRGSGGAIGVFGSETTSFGKHTLRIVASDAFGNSSEFETALFWGPPGWLYTHDSTHTIDSANTEFFFSPNIDVAGYTFDSAAVSLNRLDTWGWSPDAKAKISPDGSISVHVTALTTLSKALRLNLYPKGGFPIEDTLFNGIQPFGPHKARLKHELVDDGLLLTLYGDIRYASTSRIELFSGGKRIETLHPRFFTMQHHAVFLKPTHSRRKIDRIDFLLSRDPDYPCFTDDSIRFYVAGLEETESIPVGKDMTIRTGRKDFFSSCFLETHEAIVPLSNKEISSNKFVVSPKSILSRGELNLHLKLNAANSTTNVAGLCRFDSEKNSWRWIQSNRSVDSAIATTTTGGVFAMILDIAPPKIERLSVKHLGAVYQKRPRITMKITDNLSGIADDQNFLIKIDGDWVIPEYDPETSILVVVPRTNLELGEHHLSIEITDRLGHKAEKYLRFNVMPPASAGKRR